MGEPVQLVVNGEWTVLCCAVLCLKSCFVEEGTKTSTFFPRKIDLDDMRHVTPCQARFLLEVRLPC
jgi:hypothetical protein